MRRITALTLLPMLAVCVLMPAPAARALDDEHWSKANDAIERGIAYLRSTQNQDGSWTPQPGPAITAMVVDVMLSQPGISDEDPHVRKGIEYILSNVNEDGSIHSGILANYNTSISLSALSHVRADPRIAKVIADAEQFLRGLQWAEGMNTPDGQKITKDHPYYGGVGYGKHGRPDASNLQFMLQAMHDAGVDCKDPVFTRAMTYIHRLQGIESNDMFADAIEPDGGFIYATSLNKDRVGKPESKANPQLMERLEADPETDVKGLRTYGSMTYAMFKSMVYANLDRQDPRVVNARKWMSENWTLDRNPGMPVNDKTKSHLQGLYYYYMSMGRALDAWGSNTIEVRDGQATTFVIQAPATARYADVLKAMEDLKAKGATHISIATATDDVQQITIVEKPGLRLLDWENALVAKLASVQAEDGSWVNAADRWYEGDPNLVTAYALIALQHALD